MSFDQCKYYQESESVHNFQTSQDQAFWDTESGLEYRNWHIGTNPDIFENIPIYSAQCVIFF